MTTRWCGLSWGSSRRRGAAAMVVSGGGYRRVAARCGGDRVDRVMGRLLGLGRKTRRKSFSAAAAVVVVGIRAVVVAGIRPVVVAGKIGKEERERACVNKVQVMGTLDGRLLNNTPGISYSAATHFGGVTDWYQSQGYREPALVEYTKFLHRFAMSSDNASSAVTYTSVSSNSNRPSSWGIPLVNAGELPEMDPYEEVEDQPYADDALPTAESPGYIADSDSMEEDTDEDSIDYPDEPEDGEEDDDEDLEEDPTKEHEPDDDDDDDDTDDKDEEPTEDEEEEEHIAPADSSVAPIVDLVPSARDTKAFETDESAPTPGSPQTRVPFS
ncbi:hypothetical protein Tco_0906508 [Tanacetum coccineum]|uniref:Uncharacterized protein n=1 Tax=Tanacetum coccineum TaxID=301880 RepID=A0ABQ5CJW8_9ASTR